MAGEAIVVAVWLDLVVAKIPYDFAPFQIGTQHNMLKETEEIKN
ncbi:MULTISPECIES: hypothetical protein [Bacillus]|uniref:Uncharacterized protein n=1 Tax=Bacillus capparidis TaxID=1840411 RepID=A0ABS4CWF6_9BACI|nr:hypothetical protein [Bacillus gobiensis]MBP1081924.1 hypothetical protein [Bacillus capparidis]